MSTFTVQLQMPLSMLGTLDVARPEVEEHLQQLIVLELFRENRISVGKGAELLGISQISFVQLLARHKIEYFRQSPEELAEEVAAIEHLLENPTP